PLASRQLCANHDVGDRGTDQDVQNRGGAGVKQGVVDVLRGLREDCLEMLQGEAVWQRAEGPDRPKGEKHQPEVRRQHQREDEQNYKVSQKLLAPREISLRKTSAAFLGGGIILAAHEEEGGPEGED